VWGGGWVLCGVGFWVLKSYLLRVVCCVGVFLAFQGGVGGGSPTRTQVDVLKMTCLQIHVYLHKQYKYTR